MQEQFVPYDIALKLNENGFDWHCLAVYMNGEFQIPRGFGMAIVTKEHVDTLKGKAVLAPLWQQVIDWLREKHSIDIIIDPAGRPKMYAVFVEDWLYENDTDRAMFTYTEAREKAIVHALTLI
jgi:hypothetical protein